MLKKTIRNGLIGLLLSLNTALASGIHVIDKSKALDNHLEFHPYIHFKVEEIPDCYNQESKDMGGVPIAVYDKNESLSCKTISNVKGYATCKLNYFGLYTILVNYPDSINYTPKYPTLKTIIELNEEANQVSVVAVLDNCGE